MRFWQRYWKLILDRYQIRSDAGRVPLDIEFSVEKSTARSPNKAKIKIYNFPKNFAQNLPSRPEIQLFAGYQDINGTIFSGQGTKITLNRTELVTTVLDIEATDGGTGYRNPTISRSFTSDTRVVDALKYVLTEMGLGFGNLATVESEIQLASGQTTYPEGVVIQGSGRRYVQRILRASGFRWSIQDGNLQIRSGTNPVANQAVRLAPGTGLIGSPAKDSDGKITCVAHLLPAIYPGRLIVLESKEISGNFSAKKCKYEGKIPGDWKIDIALEPY